MIDLHCHLAWGIDDGCQTREESLALARALVACGVTAVGITPHLRHDHAWVNTRPKVHAAVQALREALAEAAVPLRVEPGAEHYLSPEFLDHVARDEHTFYAAGPYCLVEIPHRGAPPDLPSVLFRLRRQKVEPVVAHVERYGHVGVGLPLLRTLHQQGYPLQVNAGALTGHFGRDCQDMALRLLDAGLVHVISSDSHGPTEPPVVLPQALKALERAVGRETAKLLTVDNPGAILEGRPPVDMNP
jgi:protein-tyrosine phosphatase